MALRGLWLLALITACAVEPPTQARSQAIVGGDRTRPGAYPATGMIMDGDRLRCTGTLIAPDVVLTAAHCVTDKATYGDLGFTLDTDSADGVSDVVPIRFRHPHPGYDRNSPDPIELAITDDIGIALLELPITAVAPERIEAAGELDLQSGDPLLAVGYGRVVALHRDPPAMHDGETSVIRLESNEFSTAASDPQPCFGDSGGPLFAARPDGGRVLVGVISRAVGRSQMCDTGTIVTRASPYADWIDLAEQDRSDGGCHAAHDERSFGLLALAGLVARTGRRRRAC